MARRPRSCLGDGAYHVTARGVDRTAIFVDEDDCEAFLYILRETARRANWQGHAFCLMPNHYHLVLECVRDALSRGMHRLNTTYATYFNGRHRRTGHLFQSRYDARLLEGAEHLEAACRYVLANPVRAGLCEDAEQWPWSGAHPFTVTVPVKVV